MTSYYLYTFVKRLMGTVKQLFYLLEIVLQTFVNDK